MICDVDVDDDDDDDDDDNDFTLFATIIVDIVLFFLSRRITASPVSFFLSSSVLSSLFRSSTLSYTMYSTDVGGWCIRKGWKRYVE